MEAIKRFFVSLFSWFWLAWNGEIKQENLEIYFNLLGGKYCQDNGRDNDVALVKNFVISTVSKSLSQCLENLLAIQPFEAFNISISKMRKSTFCLII